MQITTSKDGGVRVRMTKREIAALQLAADTCKMLGNVLPDVVDNGAKIAEGLNDIIASGTAAVREKG